MSSVRMCDKCGKVFSELEKGWQAFTGTTFDEDDEGRRINRTVAMDACPDCAMGSIVRKPTRQQLTDSKIAGLEADITRLQEATDASRSSPAKP